MPGTDKPVPPMAYPVVWLIVGLIIVAVIVIWFVVVVLLTRKPKVELPGAPADFDPRSPYQGVRGTYLKQVDQAEADYRAGVLDIRDAHQELSSILRAYATKTRKINVTTMTLTDIKASKRAKQYAPLISAIESYYPPEFGQDTHAPTDPSAAFEKAREVLRTW